VGQRFDAHCDSHQSPARSAGRRLTVLVPLSSAEGETGGHTHFPQLGFKFAPTPGAALIWRNYMPGSKEHDERLEHAGVAPKQGRKYAINLWSCSHTGEATQLATTALPSRPDDRPTPVCLLLLQGA